MTDFHTHILPQMDDGSRNVAESLSLLKKCAKDGVSQLVLSSHYYPDRETPNAFLARRNQAFEQLNAAVSSEIPRLLLGAEVQYFDGISVFSVLSSLCIEGTSLLLIEMPLREWNVRMYRELDAILESGLQPILAHVERYPVFYRFNGLKYLCQRGYLLQMNAEVFQEGFRSLRAQRAMRRGEVQLLGSDCHRLDYRRPNMEQAIKKLQKKFGPSMIAWLDDTANTILEDHAI